MYKDSKPAILISARHARALSIACASNDVRPHLEGVHVFGDEKMVRYFASDGHLAVIAWHTRDDLRSHKTNKGKPRKLRPLPSFRMSIPKAIAANLKSDFGSMGVVGAEKAPKSSRYDWIIGGRAFASDEWPGGAPKPDFIPEKFEPPKENPAVVNPAILYRLHQVFAVLSGKGKNNVGVRGVLVPGGGNKAQAFLPLSMPSNDSTGAFGLIMPFMWDDRRDPKEGADQARACMAAMREDGDE